MFEAAAWDWSFCSGADGDQVPADCGELKSPSIAKLAAEKNEGDPVAGPPLLRHLAALTLIWSNLVPRLVPDPSHGVFQS